MFDSNTKLVIALLGQSKSSEPIEIVIELKDSHGIVLGRTTWWNVCDITERVEYNWIIGLEVKLIGEWWMIENGGRREDAWVATVISKVVIWRTLAQVLRE